MQKGVLLLFTLCLSFLSNANQWIQKADLGGSVRFGAFSFSIGNVGYMGGGYANGSNYSDFWQYDPSVDIWTQKSSYPIAVRAAGSFAINGKGYVVCGRTSSTIADVNEYDPLTNVWTAKASFPGVPVYGGAGFSIGNKGYYGIGNGGSATGPYYTAFYELDPALNTWQQKAVFPGMSRYGTFGISFSGLGFVGFGMNESSGLLFNDWWEYNPINNSWTVKASVPAIGRSYPAGFSAGNKVYVGTGRNNSLFLNDFYGYDPLNDAWSVKQSYSGGPAWVSAAFAINDTGYFGTGYDGVNYLRDFWQYLPDSTTGISDIGIGNYEFKITPNPAKDFIKVSINNNQQKASAEKITIADIAGKIIYASTIASSETVIDVKHFVIGIYTVQLQSKNKTQTAKFIKQ